MSYTPQIDLKLLLDAGVHFGHKTSRWNPKMAPYIFGSRDNIHIIDLQQTLPLMNIALKKIYDVVKNHGKVLFVSSKVQASELIAEYAEKCGQFYVNHRWLGGMMTNWTTISNSIRKLDDIEKQLADPELIATYTKKETLDLERKKEKLLKSFAGIRNIGTRPDLIVIIDTNREHLAVTEANKLNIPVIAVVDSNSDPDSVQYPVPGNDDAIRSIKLYCQLFSEAALAGIEASLANSGIDVGEVEYIAPNNQDEKVIKPLNKGAKKLAPNQSDVKETKVSADAVSKAKSLDSASSKEENVDPLPTKDTTKTTASAKKTDTNKAKPAAKTATKSSGAGAKPKKPATKTEDASSAKAKK